MLLALPVVVVMAAWGQWDGQSLQVLQSMADTVLPEYVRNSLLLCALVSLGVISMGSVSALAVTLFDFPGRRVLEWALLLPLAMPAYVVAYAYSDFLQFSGPVQTLLRQVFGLEGALWPDVRSLWGAAFVLSVCLYPYVYLLTRAALSDRAVHLMEAARLLGAGLSRRMARVALPLARPAVAAGTALALMETLSDYGVTSYLGVSTFATGIFKAWLVMDNRLAAAQLATGLLVLVMLMLWLEQRAQSRMRFGNARGGMARGQESQPMRLHGAAAWLPFGLCLMPVLLGFVAPLLIMLHTLATSGTAEPLPWRRFAGWAWNSLSLGVLSAVLAVSVAVAMAALRRGRPHRLTRGLVGLAGLGYAVPGVVIVVGLLLPVAWLQQRWPESQVGGWLTTTVVGLVWAYLVRFVAVALQAVESGYARVPPSLDESARMLGVHGWALLYRVHWPMLRRPAAAAALLVLVDVVKELPATLLLRPFNTDTLAVMAYQLARDERLGEAALPALALVLVGLVPVMLLSRTLRRSA
ncbi:MAG: iron ABC transporter permease [Pseudomonadota bacterium]